MDTQTDNTRPANPEQKPPQHETNGQQAVRARHGVETMLEQIFVGFAAYDRDWRYVYVNDKAAEMIGRRKEDLIGKTLFELFPERINSPIFREFQRIMDESKPAQLDYFSPGAQRWLRTTFYPSQDGMVTLFAAITPEHKFEETFQFLHSLTENMPDAVITTTDPAYTITSWSKGAEKLYGWRADEVIGQSATALLQSKFPGSGQSREQASQSLAADDNWQGEVIQKHKNGDSIHIFTSVSNIQDTVGTVVGHIAVNRDITERKHIEAALRESESRLAEELADVQQLQEISSQLIQENEVKVVYEKILDAAMAVMRSDMGSLQMLYPERNELLLLTYRGFASESAAFWKWVGADTSSICAEALRTKKRVVAPDIERLDYIVGSDEHDFFLKSSIRAVQTTPLVSRTGQIVGMISTHWREVHEPSERELRVMDVLARQAADLIQNARIEQLRNERERELAIVEERHRFAREVHDGVSQSIFTANITIDNILLVWKQNPEKAAALLEQVKQLTNGAVAEMRMLLLELRPEYMVRSKLSDLLGQLVQVCYLRYGVAVALDIEETDIQLPEDVHYAFYRIAQECLNNVVKHGQPKKARVRIRHQPDQVALTVVDNGQGFDPKSISAGFGLTSMRERATSIGASLHVQSHPGTGTRVKLVWKPDQ